MLKHLEHSDYIESPSTAVQIPKGGILYKELYSGHTWI